MPALPQTKHALVLRTDFSDEHAWAALCREIQQPEAAYGFVANVDCVSDPAFAGLTVQRALEMSAQGPYRTFFFIADSLAFSHPEHPLLVVDLADAPGRTFRVIPSEMWGVENNLSLANMDFDEFAGSADADGIFRGFPA
jgi:hypothetical protein